MVTLEMLVPGDRVRLSGREATFIGLGLYPGSRLLRTVVWKLDTGEWSVDALRIDQEIGEISLKTDGERKAHLIEALQSGGSVA